MGMQETISASLNEQMNKVRQQFDLQLVPLGLTKEQIETQSLEELKQSLERVNDAIAHPESFGVLRLKMTATAGVVVTTTTSEAHYEIGILSTLLERKKLILDRIRLLQGEEKIENLRDLVKRVSDETVRVKIEKELEEMKTDSSRLLQQVKEVEQARLQEQIDSQEKFARLQMEFSERKAKIWRSFLERESAATIVGSLLLIILTVAELFAMFIKIPATEIVNNGFLLILGYFFGQTVSKVSPVKQSETENK